MRLFLDANVLFTAAHNPDGRAASLLRLAASGHGELLISPHSLEEARRNVRLKQPERLGELESLVSMLAVVEESSEVLAGWAHADGLPWKDAPILGAAVQARADLLVTGDRTHFGHLLGRTLRGVKVATPAQALARVLAA